MTRIEELKGRCRERRCLDREGMVAAGGKREGFVWVRGLLLGQEIWMRMRSIYSFRDLVR
jgi:hypothetical protein